jgi:hypothetical protein
MHGNQDGEQQQTSEAMHDAEAFETPLRAACPDFRQAEIVECEADADELGEAENTLRAAKSLEDDASVARAGTISST